nr:reverse transcriptase domain-containing protein [Tanacetum cinerariifolium]
MRTRSRFRHKIAEPLRIEFPSQEDQFQEDPPEVLMADNRIMAQLLQAPTVGSEGAIFFPPSKTTNLRNEITRFQQRFDESFSKAWDRFNDLFRACPHHRFSELHQLDTFYNALNVNDEDSLNSAAGGNFLDKMPSYCLKIIKSKLKVRQTQANVGVAKVNSSSSTPAISSDVAELKDMVRALLPAETFIKTTSKRSGTLPGTEVTKDQVQTSSSQSTEPVQPPVTQSETPIFEPVVAPVSALMPNLKPSIPYPSRRDNERRCDQANEQIEKFYEIFKDMSFEISFTNALILMPKFASTLKALIGNKEKLSEMARTSIIEHCLVVILNKLPKKLGDPGKFLIPCEFPGMDECLAFADLGASINLMPLSMWKELLLLELTPTCMTLELADRSVSKPIGIAKDVSVKVGMFHFPADFVVVDFEPDPRVPLIRGRCFLKTGRALIDVHKGKLTLRIRNEAITYNLDQTSRYSANYDQMTVNKINVTDKACEEYSQKVLGFSDVTAIGSPTPSDDPIMSIASPTLTPFEDSDFLLFEEANAFLVIPHPPSQIMNNLCLRLRTNSRLVKLKRLNLSLMNLLRLNLRTYLLILNTYFWKAKTSCQSFAKELGDEEKSSLIKVLKSHKRAIAWKLSDIQEVKKLLDAGLIYSIFDSPWVSPIHCVPKKGGFIVVKNEENELILTRLVTGWREKTTFTCPYGTFAYRRMPFCVCNAPGTFQMCMLAIFHDMVEKTMEVFMDDFLIFGNSFENCLSRLDKMMQRCEHTKLCLNWEKNHFMVKEGIVLDHKISKNEIEVEKPKSMSLLSYLIPLLSKDTPFIFSEDCIKAFQTLKQKLTKAPILIAPNWDLPFGLMCDASDFAIGAVLGQRYEKHFWPIHYASKTLTEAESNYTTTEKEMLAVVYAFKKFRSYLIMNKCMVHTNHSALKYLFAKKDAKARLLRWVLLLQEFDFDVLDMKGAENLAADHLSRLENPYENGIDFMGPFPSLRGNKYILVAVDYLSKWVEAKALPTNDARVVCKFLKCLFARFGTPRAIISDRGTHVFNDQFTKVMRKYGVTHRLSTAYHPQTSGQVEVSNRGLKRILERTIGQNRASWSDKLDDALWAFRTAYKTSIGCTSYKLVYGKACHLSMELEHKAYWALKQTNFDLTVAGDHRNIQLNELNELCDQAYENSLIYKEKTKRIHDSKIKNRVFNVGDQVLLFNSRLKIFSGKLKTRWSRPFTITKVFSYGTVELSQAKGPNFKVNGHRIKHYFEGDVPQLVVPDL